MLRFSLITFLFSVGLCACCDNSTIDSETKATTIEDESINKRFKDNLKNDTLRYRHALNALEHGDTVAYDNMSADYFLGIRQHDFLYFAMVMADKYKYPRAYSDVEGILRIQIRDGSYYSYENEGRAKRPLKKLYHYYLLKTYLDRIYRGKRNTLLDDEFGKDVSTARLKKYLERLEKDLFSAINY